MLGELGLVVFDEVIRFSLSECFLEFGEFGLLEFSDIEPLRLLGLEFKLDPRYLLLCKIGFDSPRTISNEHSTGIFIKVQLI